MCSRHFRALLGAIFGLLSFLGPTVQAQTWGPEVLLAEDVRIEFSGLTAALRPDGGFTVAWPDDRGADLHSLGFVSLNVEGDAVVDTWDTDVYPSVRNLALAMTSEGPVSLWIEQPSPSPSTRQIYAESFDLQGESVASRFVVSCDGSKPGRFQLVQLSGGNLLAVWQAGNPIGSGVEGFAARRFLHDGTLIGDCLELPGPPQGVFTMEVVPVGEGFLAVWSSFDDAGAMTQVFDANGAGGEVFALSGSAATGLDIAADPRGGYLVIWEGLGEAGIGIYGRRLDDSGAPVGEIFVVSGAVGLGALPEVAIDIFQRTWVVWRNSLEEEVLVALLGADGEPLAEVQPVSTRPGRLRQDPEIVVDGTGRAFVVWKELAVANDRHAEIRARTISVGGCSAGVDVLCLMDGRFRVEVEWSNFQGETGGGRVVPFQSTDSGLFWFFDANNWEVMVKVIDGCDFNDHYWVFSAATTDIAYELVVTDIGSGEERRYGNSLGEAAPALTDTTAFNTCSFLDR